MSSVTILDSQSRKIIERWVRQIDRDARLVRLKDVPEWRLRAFGLAVVNRLARRLEPMQNSASGAARGFAHLRFRQWVPDSELARCLLILRREVLASAGATNRLLDPDAAEFRARADRFFDDFLTWRRWELD
jgi:hypothetical protein